MENWLNPRKPGKSGKFWKILENSGKFWKLEIDDISGGILLNLVILMLDFVELMTNHVE